MKIGFISTVAVEKWPATEYLWKRVADSLLLQGHEVVVSVPENMKFASKLKDLANAGAFVDIRPEINSMRLHLITRRCLSDFKNFFLKKPDIVIITQGALLDFQWMPDLVRDIQKHGTPYFIITHCNDDAMVPSDEERQAARDFFCKARHLFFVSNQNRNLAERQLACDLSHASIILGAYLSECESLPWPLDCGTIQMACVARLNARAKGQDIILEVLNDPFWKQKDWALSFVGDGKDQFYLKELAKFYGLEKRVFFKGFVSDLRSIWSEHHFHVLASRYEGCPLVTLEAMLMGRFCVTTDVGRNSSFIDDKVNGFLCDAPTAKSFHKALKCAWDFRNEWSSMSQRAHQKAFSIIEEDPAKALEEKILRSEYARRA